MLNKPTWSLSNNRFNPILVGQEIRTYGYRWKKTERLETIGIR